jgi:hypothetical protein
VRALDRGGRVRARCGLRARPGVGHHDRLGTIAPARVERTLELCGDEPVLTARYRITSLDVRPLPYTWGIHPLYDGLDAVATVGRDGDGFRVR